MTTKAFADLIGVTTRTIQRTTRDRDIAGWPTPVRITPSVLLYERADVERFDLPSAARTRSWGILERLRGCMRIDELSRELEKAEQASGRRHPTDGKPTKTQVLSEAGISTTSANRCEQLVGRGVSSPDRADAVFGAMVCAGGGGAITAETLKWIKFGSPRVRFFDGEPVTFD